MPEKNVGINVEVMDYHISLLNVGATLTDSAVTVTSQIFSDEDVQKVHLQYSTDGVDFNTATLTVPNLEIVGSQKGTPATIQWNHLIDLEEDAEGIFNRTFYLRAYLTKGVLASPMSNVYSFTIDRTVKSSLVPSANKNAPGVPIRGLPRNKV